ncbi:ribonuclease HII [Aurantiacibacter sediminis]|uniref:Ribonuclease HII n=1 Tax=Aurantiacibacter sediminis TaxID=2793064 RepID=A0ABS0N5G6_9SPHN|nr:ribonuclease HII [Aurantiacibacter sediminis]MBH5323047.1 ribonuclease HII [Aurantiacibacter sediminis]
MLSGTPSADFCARLGKNPLVAGVDEAGRGPLAGPVVAAAVVLCEPVPDGVNDSKKLSAKARADAETRILRSCAYGIGVVDVGSIDELNIFGATMLAMSLAMERLCEAVGETALHTLIDGNLTPEGRCDRWRWPATPIVGGDGKEACIGAASIIAKEYRDRIMVDAAERHPHYGWERNKGYGSKEHMEALRVHGPTPFHRRSFAPVAQMELSL